VLENGVVVGRIFTVPTAPQGRPWMWASGHNGDIKRAAHGCEPTREAAMAAFAKSWRRSSGRQAMTKPLYIGQGRRRPNGWLLAHNHRQGKHTKRRPRLPLFLDCVARRWVETLPLRLAARPRPALQQEPQARAAQAQALRLLPLCARCSAPNGQIVFVAHPARGREAPTRSGSGPVRGPRATARRLTTAPGIGGPSRRLSGFSGQLAD
jgi:hypothetical protein